MVTVPGFTRVTVPPIPKELIGNRHKKTPDLTTRGFLKNRQYLLSRLQHYHRLKVLNYCVRDGNRCDHFDIVTGKTSLGLFTQTTLVTLYNLQLKGK
jgi:hypothetical protein